MPKSNLAALLRVITGIGSNSATQQAATALAAKILSHLQPV